jgi:hypothetical protein
MMPNFDPSKMDPKLLMELSRLIQELPPEKLNRMQSLMHNMMAGHDVTREMEEFEKTLPPGFREKLFGVMMTPAGTAFMSNASSGFSSGPEAPPIDVSPNASPGLTTEEMNVRQARMTVLNAVADGRMTPEEAEKLLFAG